MGTRVELIVTDLDGTLWEHHDTIHDRTLEAIGALTDRGLPLLVATGRRIGSTRRPLAAVGLAPPAVVLNGALGLDLHDGRRFHAAGFTTPDAVAVLDVFLDHGVEPCVYLDCDEPSVRIGACPSTHPGHLAGFHGDAVAGDLVATVAGERVLAFAVLGLPDAVALALGEALAPIANPHVGRDREWGGLAVTVAPPVQSKWDGVVAFCADRGLDPRAVLAIGDGPNDLELLDGAAVAVVPEDGHPEALARADHVVGRAVDGGWADLLDLC